MSGNGKPVQLAPNSNQRYPCGTRPLTPQRTDSYGASGGPVGTTYTANSTGGTHAQGNTMRGLPQPPTPPQQELKQGLYNTGGPRAPNYQYRSGQQTPNVQRPSTHHRQQGAWPSGQNYLYNVPTMFVQHSHMAHAPQQYQQQQPPRASYFPQPMQPMMPQQQHQHPYYNFPTSYLYGGGGGTAPQQPTMPLTTPGRTPSAPLPNSQPLQQPPTALQQHPYRYPVSVQHADQWPHNNEKKRRTHALPIVDPKSGKDVTSEILKSNSSDTMSETGERQAPQLDDNGTAVIEEFARLVNNAVKDNDEPAREVSDKMELESVNDAPQIQDVGGDGFEDMSAENKQSNVETCEEKRNKRNQTSELSETPVVSAISNSPEIIPKQCYNVIKQKQVEVTTNNEKGNRYQTIPKVKSKPVPPLSESGLLLESITFKGEGKEFEAQHILTSALLQTSKSTENDKELHFEKLEYDIMDNDFPIPETQLINDISITLETINVDHRAESNAVVNNGTIPQVDINSLSEVLPPPVVNIPKVKIDSKKHKSRSNNNERSNATICNVKKAEGEQISDKHSPGVSATLDNIISPVDSTDDKDESIVNPVSQPIGDSEIVDEASTNIITIEDRVSPNTTEHNAVDVTNNSCGNYDTDVLCEPSALQTVSTEVQVECVVIEKDSNIDVESSVILPNNNTDEVNEVAPETNTDTNEKIADKSKTLVLRYTYKDDQWSPLNTGGQKRYDTDFLMMLRNDPNSKKKPENLNQLEIVSELLARQPRNNSDPSRSVPMMQRNDLLPTFAKNSTHSATPNRKSQHGKPSSKGINTPGSGLSNRPNIIHVNLSLRQEVKLNETENAWKPSRMRTVALEEDELATQELYKTFRSVLNKLTPQNFEVLIAQVRKLNINTSERLSGVINLVFEKAIDEPNFSVAYANMCKELELIKVKVPSDQESDKEVSFRNLIVGRCQSEFEKEDDSTKNAQKEVDECTDPEKKKELMLSLEETERKVRRRSVGNVRFIGELYKQNLITSNIIVYCIKRLLTKVEEETLECVCKLLSTIGKVLDAATKVDLNPFFNTMKSIVDSNEKKVNNRVRFMLQDVIDLRMNDWVPRQQAANPKTTDQIKLELEAEQKVSAFNNYPAPSNTSRKDERPSNMNKRGGSKSVTDDGGWSMAHSRGARTKQATPYIVDSCKLSKLFTLTPIPQTSLQPTTQSLWGKGSTINKKSDSSPVGHKTNNNAANNNRRPFPETSNAYMVLDNQSDNPSNSRNEGPAKKGSYKTKGASIERSTFKSESEEQTSINVSQLSINDKIKDLLESSSDSHYKLLAKIQSDFSKEDMPTVARELILWAMDNKKMDVFQLVGEVTGHMVDDKNLTSTEFLTALKQTMDASSSHFLESGNDLWKMLASFLWRHMKKDQLKLQDLCDAFSKVIEVDKGFNILTAIFLEKLKTSPDDVKGLWEKSSTKLTDWMSEENMEQFLEEFPLKWINQRRMSQDEACHQMLEIMRANNSRDALKEWIVRNIGEAVKEPWFIRPLTMAVHIYALCATSSSKPRFDPTDTPERLNEYYPLLSSYIGGEDKQELECLFALQHLMHKWEHPPGITVPLFDFLWEYGDIISFDGFISWERNEDPKEQEGKGVMLKTLTSFLTIVKADMDSDTPSVNEDY